MQSTRSEVIRNSIWYTLGNILLKFFSFLLIPLYTCYLSPDQYGEINLALGFSNVVSCLIMCGLQTGVIRFYTDCNGDKTRIAQMFGSVITFVIVLSLIIIFLLTLTHNCWIHIVFSSINFFPIILLAIFISGAVATYTVYQEFLKGAHKAKKSVILSYVYFILLLITNLITVIWLKWGASGVLISTLIVNLLMIGIMLIDLYKWNLIYIGIKVSVIKDMLKYSLPLVPHSISYNISNFFTRVIINSKINTSTLGLYSLASQFGGIADVVSNSVQSAFQPWLYERMQQVEAGNKVAIQEINNLTVKLLWIYGFIYLMIGTWTQEAIEIMSQKSYYSAWIYVPFLVCAVAIKSPLYFYQNLYYYHKNLTKYIFIFTVSGCLSSMLLVLLLVPKYGVFGAIWGDIISVMVRVSLTIWFGKYIINSVYSISKLIYITIASTVWLFITVFPSYFGLLNQSQNIIYKILCILLYLALIVKYHSNKNFIKNKT